jgi:hypothetical protein
MWSIYETYKQRWEEILYLPDLSLNLSIALKSLINWFEICPAFPTDETL